MTDDWDFYILRVDDEPASIFVDLGIQADAPVPLLPYMAYVRLYMKQPRADGLSSKEEFETLAQIEKSMESQLCGDAVGYVGRNSSSGCRDFYFYVATPDNWQSKVELALAAFNDYQFEAGTRKDPTWSTYLNFLLPGDMDRQRIENRRVCRMLERHGDRLVAKREIDHWSYFPSQADAKAYLAEIVTIGFELRSSHFTEGASRPYGAQVWRSDVPSFENIDAVTLPLFEAAARHRGEYDGWECPVETQQTPPSST